MQRVTHTRSVIALVSALVLPVTAGAGPATPVGRPGAAKTTRYTGWAFDTCTAPPLSAIRSWSVSPYRALGIYISGSTRSCAQPQLTARWVGAVARLGWKLIPIHKGLQPQCGGRATDAKIAPAIATRQGVAAAGKAANRAKALGILPGSAVYNDIESYKRTNAPCGTAVLHYLSGWTRELHRLGYVSGVYVNLSSGAPDLSSAYTSTSYARPDAIWIARYDGDPSLTGWAGIPDDRWAVHQRAKQYKGGHNETYGGTTLNIDNDRFDAPVATTACPCSPG